MKISNETKIGALTVVAVVFLILGFNFLKGKSVLKTGFFLYAKYSDLKKLASSNAVYANGLQVGTVYSTAAADASLQQLIVEIKLSDDKSAWLSCNGYTAWQRHKIPEDRRHITQC